MNLLVKVTFLASLIAAYASAKANLIVNKQKDVPAHVLNFEVHGEPGSKCIVSRQNEITTYHFRYWEPSDNGYTISAMYIQGIRAAIDSSGGFPDAYSSLKIYIGLDELFSQHLSVNNGMIQKTMQWGSFVEGAQTATINVSNNSTANGTIDGRAFVVKHSNMTFLDGEGPPILTLPTKLKDPISSFTERMARAWRVGQTVPKTGGISLTHTRPPSAIYAKQHGPHGGCLWKSPARWQPAGGASEWGALLVPPQQWLGSLHHSKVARGAQIVVQLDRGLEDNPFTSIEELITSIHLHPADEPCHKEVTSSTEQHHPWPAGPSGPVPDPQPADGNGDPFYETSSSGMFPLDGLTAFKEADKLSFLASIMQSHEGMRA
ncbi:hypothetical protein FOBRF1_013729 [Fusarium oxysporum]